MDFVTPWLAIGAAGEAADAGTRRRHGIDAVLSLLPVDFDAGAAHLTLAIEDRVAVPAASIAAATSFIHRQERAGRKTLLHCQMGISRSPALAACYLHEYGGRPLAEALSLVRRARPLADPHPAIVASIGAHYGQATTSDVPSPVDLSANENPLGPSPMALAVLQSALAGLHRYPDRQGMHLRRALARELGGRAEQVLLGNGSCEVLDLAARALLAPGERAIVMPPCFPAYASAIRRAHGDVVTVPLVATDDFACRLDAVAAAIDARTRLVFLGNPNNPTGRGVAPAALAAFLTALPPHVTVVLDEAYREYAGPAGSAAPDTVGGEALADGPALVRAGCRLLVVRSFSKLHGLAGLRIGYAFGPPDIVAALDAQRSTYNTNAAAQAAALAALEDRDHQAASRRLAADGRAMLADGLAALGFACLPSCGNFLLTRLPDDIRDRGDGASSGGHAARVLVAGLADAGIAVKPGAAFGLPDHLRISVGLPDENRRFLATLATVLAAVRKERGSTTHNHEGS